MAREMANSNPLLKWTKRIVIGLSVVLLLAFAGVNIVQRVSDGPTGPLTGGTFSSGTLTERPAQGWHELEGDFEFELVGEGTSRTAGGIVLDQVLYITCDLGFIWARLPEGTARTMLNVIWWFKDWHLLAERDGRIRIRKDEHIYSANVERVHNPQLIARLKTSLEGMAGEYFGTDFGPRPVEEPNDIWFFKVVD